MRSKQQTQGFALVTALSFVIIIGVVVGTALYLSATNRRLSAETVRTTQAQYAAEAGIELVVKKYWTEVWTGMASGPKTLKAYQVKLNPLLINENLNDSNTGSIDGNTFSLKVTRRDITSAPQRTLIEIESTGKSADGKTTRVIKQVFRIAPRNYAGLQYALLSNNVNCTFCHTKIETMEGAYGNSAGGKDRVKVGTLESLEFRVDGGRADYWDAVDTAIYGTLYSRGDVLDQKRTPYTLGSTDDIRFTTTDANGKVVYNNAQTIYQNTQKANVQDCKTTTCAANGNFYQNYPGGTGPDGDLPDSFPVPVPDNADGLGDRFTSNDEWKENIADTVAEEGALGTLSVAGGTMQFYGTTVSDANKIRTVARNGSKTSITDAPLTSDRGVPGNLNISGNMKINGTVFVDGDVVISGRLSGKGKIIARGNIYVTGDIEYNCGTQTVPADCDYTDTKNLPQLALVAGGNTLVGDYLSPRYASTTALTDKNTVEPGFPNNFKNNNQLSFVAAEIANFNKLEYDKATKNSAYVPRFYRMRANDPIIRYTGTGEHAGRYNTGELAGVDKSITCNNGDCSKTDLAAGSTEDLIYRRARVLDLSPTANWLTEQDIKQAWIDKIETPARAKAKAPVDTANNKPLQLDATVYTSNAAFALARGCDNVAPCPRSKIDGRIVMNGSLIAADSGVLSPGQGGKKDAFTQGQRDIGLRIHYDARIQDLISLGAGDVVNLSRSDYQLKGVKP